MTRLLLYSLPSMLRIVHLRALPFLAYLALSRGPAKRTRAAAVMAVLGLAWLCTRWGLTTQELALDALAVAYLGLLALPIHAAASRWPALPLTRSGLLAALIVAFLVLPAVLLPRVQSAIFLLLGWEACLAGYSYILDARTSGGSSPRRAAFFLVVNPTLMLGHSGQRVAPPGFHPAGAVRVAQGLLVGWLGVLLGALTLDDGNWLSSSLSGYSLFLAQGALIFVSRYSALSGLASMQLGAMRLIGWEIPERYRLPFLARTPSEFWQRWNTYVTGWFQRYVFMPLARSASHQRWLHRRAGAPLSAMATLLAVGAYHDLFTWMAGMSAALNGTAGFAIASLCVPLWLASARLRSLPEQRRVRVLVSRLSLMHCTFAVFWVMQRGI